MHRVLFICAALACLAAPIPAQSTPRGWSLDAAIGFGKGWGGEYFDRVAPAAEFALAVPHGASRFVGFALGGQATPAGGDICHFDATQSRCLTRFPATFHVGVLGGLERANKYDAVRAMVGPAYFGGDGEGFGALLRIDGSMGFGHVGLVGALQGALDVRSRETLRLGTLLFGVRLQ
jgi:hypothetical protein